MTKVNRVNPKSLAKIQAMIFFVIGVINAIFSVLTVFTVNTALKNPPSPVPFILVSLILMPLFYAVIGFVLGLVFAFLYNLFAKRFGGVEIEVESR